jgi:5,10-methylenetetrahydromethanopterin reductase
MVAAAAIAMLEQPAPGRTAVAVGTGFTGRLLLGQAPMRWADVETYVRQLRGLLRGEEIELDDCLTEMLHPPGYVAPRPINTPIVIAANGPKGLRVARELGDGVMSVKEPVNGFDWSIVAGAGTVLDEGESADSERVLAAVGPYVTMLYHYFYEVPTNVDLNSLPLGSEWRRRIDEIPIRKRHLRLNESHMVGIAQRDRDLVTADSIVGFSWTGTQHELQTRFAAFEAAGATEVYYEPTGPDLEREIVTFARAVGLSS